MSLHTLAQHLQSAGRGEDKVLVHMTPGEVKGLQALAMAHGGSLTINPETGLPEAGFLRSLLPMLAGAALTIGSGGALSPLMASMIVGGGTAAVTGSLQQGLMAGLGAYGGAGLGGGLTAAGAAQAAGASAGLSAGAGAGAGAATAAAPVSAGALPGVVGGGIAPAGGLGSAIAPTISTTAAPAGAVLNPASGQLIASNINYAGQGMVNPVSQVVGKEAAPSVFGSVGDRFAQAGRGFQNITSDTDKFTDFLSEQKKPLMYAGIGTLGMYQQQGARPPEEAPYVYTPFNYVRPYNPSERMPGATSERTYFRAADGGLATLPVEQMSQQNAMLDNTRYPMAFQQTPTYASPSERPISQNIIYPATDADVTPYSGAPRMAGGGVVALADGGASLTPAQREAAIKAGEAAYKTQQTNIKNIVKPYDPSVVKTPAGGFTNTNVNVAYSPFLVQQRNEVTALQAQLPQYLNADGTPKFGYEGVVSLLRSEIDSNLGELKESLNDFYRNIPRTDLDFTDPKNAAKTTQNQVNEENQINWLIANFINTVPGNAKLGIEGLANTDFGKDFISKRDAESNQRLEASLFQTHFAPVLANIKGEPTAADRVRLQNAMFAAGLIDKTGKPTAKSNQMTGLASFGTETIQGYGETLSPYARKSTTVGGRVPTKDLNSLEKIPITLVNQGWDPDPNKTLEEADVINLFEEVAGRLPTADEMKRFLGRKGTMASAADAINGLPDVQAGGAIFTPQEINAQAKYYWGRDMTKGELEHFTQRALAGQFNNFATLRNALTQYVASGNVNPYKQNLQKQLDASFAPKPEGLSDSKIVEIYRSTLGRMPYEDEYKSARDGKISEADLKKNLLNTNEYLETFVYKKRPTKETGAEVGDTGLVSGRPGGKDTTTTTGTTTGGTTTGGPTKVSEGATLGDTGLTAGDKTTTTETKAPPPPPPRVLTPEEIEAERQRIAKFREAYTTFTPSTKVAEPVLDERQQQAMAEAAGNIYRPQFIPTKELPDITFYKDPSGKSFAYRDPNKELGLTGLYAQMSEVMPSLRGGITFTPTQGAVLASPFSNVTPGLVTLQSTVAPQPYTPPTPVVPGTTTQQVALTPEEQLLLSQAQAMSQNKARGMAMGGYAGGGYHLGDYSDGGRLLKGPGDGVSDSIPASIGNRQPARLADGEFVIPARIVSELGNGSTDAGARQLYAMMDRIQKRRRNTIGKGRVAVDSKARALLPA